MLLTVLFMTLFQYAQLQMDGYIVGGNDTSILIYPHSAFLSISPDKSDTKCKRTWSCGSSILTQKIVLTAAHCLDSCSTYCNIVVMAGNVNKVRGYASTAANFQIHENYNSFDISNDIALVSLKTPFKLGENIKRVAIMKNPPYSLYAEVAGWGLIGKKNKTNELKSASQRVWSRLECERNLLKLAEGTICAGGVNETTYTAKGDSGSALVIRGFIQIGIVSYKEPTISMSLIVYTNVSYYYDWIQKTASSLNCSSPIDKR